MKKIRSQIFVLAISALCFLSSAHATTVPTASTVPPAAESTMKAALNEFRDMGKRERKARIREVKNTLDKFKAEKAAGKKTDDNTILLAILAILLPPLAVFLKEEALTTKFWISLILTLLFWIPGVVYSLLVVFDII